MWNIDRVFEVGGKKLICLSWKNRMARFFHRNFSEFQNSRKLRGIFFNFRRLLRIWYCSNFRDEWENLTHLNLKESNGANFSPRFFRSSRSETSFAFVSFEICFRSGIFEKIKIRENCAEFFLISKSVSWEIFLEFSKWV